MNGRRDLRLLAFALAVAGCDSAGTVNNGDASGPTTTLRVSLSSADLEVDGASQEALISGDGGTVAFVSNADDLHPEAVTGARHVYVKRLASREVVLCSRRTGADGDLADGQVSLFGISRDGLRVLFSCSTPLDTQAWSGWTNLYVRDLSSHTTLLVSRMSGETGHSGWGDASGGAISEDGRWVAFHSSAADLHPDDTDSRTDVFLRDLDLHVTTLISRASGAAGAKADGFSQTLDVSADGTRVLFSSTAGNLGVPLPVAQQGQLYVRDLTGAPATLHVSRGPGPAGDPGEFGAVAGALSSDGAWVVFTSSSRNLHPEDTDFETDVFVRNLADGAMELASRASGAHGVKAIGPCLTPRLSADGRFVAFASGAANLVPGDTNGVHDVFRRDRATGSTVRVSVRTFGSEISTGVELVSLGMSEDGSAIVFSSAAPDIVSDDVNGVSDVFVRSPLR